MHDFIQLYESIGIYLKQKGNKYTACCPFHTEKTPSFFVYSDGSYHCFGCSAHGTLEELLNICNNDKINLWIKSIDSPSKTRYIDSVVNKNFNFVFENLKDKNIENQFSTWKKFDEYTVDLEYSLYNNDDLISSILDFDKKVRLLVEDILR